MFEWVPLWLRRTFAALVLVLVVWFLVLPQFGQAEQAYASIAGVHVGALLLGTLLVIVALYSQAEVVRSVLPRSERPNRFTMLRMELTTTAISHTVPGGTAAGTAMAYRLLTRAGASPASTGFALGVRGIGGAVVLNVLLWVALIISIPTRGFDSRYTTAAAIGALLLGAVGAAAIGLLKAPTGTGRIIARVVRPLPFVDQEAMPGAIARLATQLRSLLTDRALAARVVLWAAVYWIGNAAALWVLLAAFGWTGDPVSVVVAFGLVNVLAALPITPRGLGLFEAVLIPMLVGFGATVGEATLGVIGYRLLSFWAPIPLGSLSYLSIRIQDPSVPGDEDDAMEELEESREHRESFDEWAARHGLRPRSGDSGRSGPNPPR